VDAFLGHCESEGLKFSTIRKYRNSLNHLRKFCSEHGIDTIGEIATVHLDNFRAGRALKPITSSKELELLRQFCGFCYDRKWSMENAARRIKFPRNIKQNDVVPFSVTEVQEMIQAANRIGRGPYERLRASAMVLTLRYTALRIGDVAMLSRDRVSKDRGRWRIFLHTEKNGKPVFLPIPTSLKAALDSLPLPRGCGLNCRYYFWNEISSERSMKSIAERSLAAVFRASGVVGAHAHRFRHTLATELLGEGASFEDVADILGNSPEVVRKHYVKWSPARQARIDDLMERVHTGTQWTTENGPGLVQ
jgi:integrase/recombinase XerC